MKVTVEVPDELIRRVRMRSVQRNEKFKDTVVKLLEAGLATARPVAQSATFPKPVRLKGRGPLTVDDIERAIAAQRS